MSGAGRGRGWLNIRNGQQQQQNRPGFDSQQQQQQQQQHNQQIHSQLQQQQPTSPLVQEFNTQLDFNSPTSTASIISEANNQYNDIVTLVKQLNVNDDGIKLNRKLTSLYQTFGSEFKNDKEIKECAQYLFQLGLKDELVATNYALMMSLQPFLVKPIYEVKLRDFLINDLQECYNKAKQMQMSEPKEFRNFVKIMARFTRAKLCDGSSIKIFAMPLTHCFELLLDTGKPEDIETFINQFNITLVYLRETAPEDLTTIVNKIRYLLVKNELATCKCRARLLLALDISETSTLPLSVYKFYVEQLGEKAMTDIQISNTPLTIQIPSANKSEIQNLNHNKEAASMKSSSNEKGILKQQQHHNFYNNDNSSSKEKNVSSSSSSIGNWGDAPNISPPRQEKTGRPILGADDPEFLEDSFWVWFGLTCYGFPDPFKDMMKESYKEPQKASTEINLDDKTKNFTDLITQLDCYIGHADGYAYNSNDRLRRMHKKGIFKPVGPNDMYKYPGTNQMKYGWWKYDPALENETWYKNDFIKSYPSSETTRYVNKALKIDKMFRL